MSWVTDFGVKGDGTTDDTAALEHAIEEGDGEIVLPRGDYRVTRPIVVALEKTGRLALRGSGGLAKILMEGKGPAFHLVGTHEKTANPDDFTEQVWRRERMPTIRDLEIEGRHPQADGIRLEGVMQPIIQGILIRECRHAIHLVQRNRNVLIADCHLYHNSGIGVFLDHVNLHQININSNHISYHKKGGIRIENSEVRNIQIVGNDIEYNYDLESDTSADVLFDARKGTIREGTIVGNTIQAKPSPNGANVRLLGVGEDDPNAAGLMAISGNLLGNQEHVVHLRASRGVTLAGNCIYSGHVHSLWIEDCEHILVSGGSFDHNPEYNVGTVDAMTIERSRNVNLSGLILQHTRPIEQKIEATLDLKKCQNVSISGCQFLRPRTRAIRMDGCRVVKVEGCTVRGSRHEGLVEAIDTRGGTHIMVINNFLPFEGGRLPGVQWHGNIILDD